MESVSGYAPEEDTYSDVTYPKGNGYQGELYLKKKLAKEEFVVEGGELAKSEEITGFKEGNEFRKSV